MEQELTRLTRDSLAAPDQCTLYLYDNCILFYPIHPCLEEELTITVVENEVVRWQRQQVRKKEEMFTRIPRSVGLVGCTFGGFADKLVLCLVRNRIRPRVYNMQRGDMNLNLDAMSGFRFSQEKLLRTALAKNKSGLIGAPTRYGKTTLIINTLRAAEGRKCLVILPGVDLCRQMYEACKAMMPRRDIALLCTGSRYRFQNNDVTVCSVDSLEKTSDGTPSIDFGGTELILFDEPHAMVTRKRAMSINKFRHARKIGFGATLEGRSDRRDEYIVGLIGPVLAQITYKQAVEEGAICPINVIFLRIPICEKFTEHASREGAYDDIFFKNRAMAELTRRICDEVIPLDWQTLLFIKHEDQAKIYLDAIGTEHTIAMAKRMTPAQRKEITARCASGDITRCLCSNIFVQGVTFSHSRVLVNLAAGGNNTTAIQKPGRLAEVRPGKKCGIMIDFLFEPKEGSDEDTNTSWKALCGESNSRLKAYKKIGYGIHIVDSFDALKAKFNLLK